MSFPYLDLAGFLARTIIPSGDVAIVEAAQPGYTIQRIAAAQSFINARLRKRYGSSLPMGATPPIVEVAGVNPPQVTLQGRSVVGSYQIRIAITTGGTLGTAIAKWTVDGTDPTTAGGATTTATAASVALGSTGLSAIFPAGTYAIGHSYAAATPVPEIVLGWLTALAQVDVFLKRGVNPQDPTIATTLDMRAQALTELKESADSNTGLLDIPTNEGTDSAITTGGPMGYAEQSPYTWTDVERANGRAEDLADINGAFPTAGD